MKHKLLTLVLAAVVIISLVVVGCAKPAPVAPPSPTPTPAPTPSPQPTPEKVFEWEIYCTDPIHPASPAGLWPEFADEIYQATNGCIKLTVYGQGEHPYMAADAFRLMEDLKPAIAEIAFSKVMADDPRLSVTDIPMLFPPDQDAFLKTADGLMESYFGPIIAEHGYQPLIVNCWQPQAILGKDFFVTDWNSLKGKKIRTWNPQLVDLVELLGGTPVSVPLGEVYTSLQTGLVDGIISNTGGAYYDAFGEVAKCLTLMQIQYGVIGYFVSQDALNALPNDVREEFLNWAISAQSRARESYRGTVSTATLMAVTELGCSIKAPDPRFWQEVRSKCPDTVWKKWIERCGGPESDSAAAFNVVVGQLREMGYEVPSMS